jgi:hypothetical protein
MKRFSFVMLLACPLALSAADGAFDLTLAGKKCKETDLQTLECTYKVGDDLNFTITGLGQPNVLIAVDRSSFDADYYGAVGVLHGYVIVRPGEKS